MNISKRLLSVDNPKAEKAVKYGWLNGIHYMSPSDIAGVGNLCPHASPGCIALCLGYHSGQASMVANADDTANKNSVRKSRDLKAQQFMGHRKEYEAELVKQIAAFAALAAKHGLKPCVRLNGSTDIAWGHIVSQFPEVQFTEYTKNPKRYREVMGLDDSFLTYPNLHMTFSRSETNEDDCLKILQDGGSVAVVFEKLPKTWHGFRVINGDEHDLRHLDPPNVVVGLTPKGAARKDASGFVVRSN